MVDEAIAFGIPVRDGLVSNVRPVREIVAMSYVEGSSKFSNCTSTAPQCLHGQISFITGPVQVFGFHVFTCVR